MLRSLIVLQLWIASGALRPPTNGIGKVVPTPKTQLGAVSSKYAAADAYCIVSDELPEYRRQDYLYDSALFSVPVVIPFLSFLLTT